MTKREMVICFACTNEHTFPMASPEHEAESLQAMKQIMQDTVEQKPLLVDFMGFQFLNRHLIGWYVREVRPNYQALLQDMTNEMRRANEGDSWKDGDE